MKKIRKISFVSLLLFSITLFSSIHNPYTLIKISSQDGFKKKAGRDAIINYSGRFISIFSEQKVGKIIFNPNHPSYKSPGTFFNLEDARFSAIRRAKENAVLNLSEVISSLWYDSNFQFSELMNQDALFSKRISELLSEPIFLSTRVHLNKVRVELFLSLNGRNSLSDYLPGSYGKNKLPFSSKVDNTIDSYTSLIVDVRHLPYQPCLQPGIYRDDGLQIYGTSFVSANYAVDVGLAGYASSLSKARKMSRAGSHPLYTLASELIGKRKCDLVLSAEDSMKILAKAESRKSLRHCQFIIITK